MIAVVIPALDEEGVLPATLAALAPALSAGRVEVVVADGGSRDRTVEVARAHGVRLLVAPPGRASQMNAGAAATTGDPIVFLHADTVIGGAHLERVAEALADPEVTFGSFPIRIDAGGLGFRLIEAVANLRTRLDRTPYGDQAIFVRRAAFAAVGGYPPVPILEDVLLGRKLGRAGRFRFLTGTPVCTSARRWQRFGLARTTLRNWATRALFELGSSPERLRRIRDGAARQRR